MQEHVGQLIVAELTRPPTAQTQSPLPADASVAEKQRQFAADTRPQEPSPPVAARGHTTFVQHRASSPTCSPALAAAAAMISMQGGGCITPSSPLPPPQVASPRALPQVLASISEDERTTTEQLRKRRSELVVGFEHCRGKRARISRLPLPPLLPKEAPQQHDKGDDETTPAPSTPRTSRITDLLNPL
eukprot:TRINITY_DN844_c0_g1_i3.p2 TRINITY_DN844_c0_g1~~TRINITY_DN844_c0_g1_i3.p2  ORF type:complete len:188 (-),score=37.55 TRINITY_DN844_c0_g1_i3:64-627(-)